MERRHESGVEWWTPRSPAVASWDPAVVAFGEESWPTPVSSALHFHTPISVRWLQQNTQDTRQEQSPSTVAESAVLTWNIGDDWGVKVWQHFEDSFNCGSTQRIRNGHYIEKSVTDEVLCWLEQMWMKMKNWHVCSKSAAAQCDHRYDYGAREGERSELQSNFVPNLWNSIAWVPPVPTGARCPDGQGWRNFLWSRLGFPLEPLKLCMKLHEHI